MERQSRRFPRSPFAVLGILASLCALAILVYAAVTAGPDLVLWLSTGGPEHSAGYYPPHTMVYGWLTLAPTEGQRGELAEIYEELNGFRAFRNLVDDLEDLLERERGADFERDVVPWAGPEFSFGVLDFTSNPRDLVLAATIGVRDHNVARDFVDIWLDHAEDTRSADFESGSHRDFDTWGDRRSGEFYGLSEELLVFANSEEALEDVIDVISGRTSLADAADFQEAVGSLPSRRFASMFVRPHSLLDVVMDMEGNEDMLDEWFLSDVEPEDTLPRWAAVSFAVHDRALSARVSLPMAIDSPLEVPDLLVPANMVPVDAPFFLAGTFDPDLDRWREALRAYGELSAGQLDELNSGLESIYRQYGMANPPRLEEGSGVADVVDLVLELVWDSTGVDPEADLAEHLGGDYALVVHDLDLEEVGADPLTNSVDAVFSLSYQLERGRDFEESVHEISGFVERVWDVSVREASVGAAGKAVLHRTGTGYEPGYVFHGGRLVLGTNRDVLKRTVRLADGESDSLESDPEYRRVREHLPEQSQFVLYADPDAVTGQLRPGLVGLTGSQLRALRDILGRFMFSGYAHHCRGESLEGTFDCEAADFTEFALVLTLFE